MEKAIYLRQVLGIRWLPIDTRPPHTDGFSIGDFKTKSVLVVARSSFTEPFAGESGELLRRMLAAIQLNENTVAFATFGDEDSLGNHQAELKSKIEASDLRAILILDLEFSRQLLGPCANLGAISPFLNNCVAMATHSPQELLRNPALKKPSWQHLQAFARELLRMSENHDFKS